MEKITLNLLERFWLLYTVSLFGPSESSPVTYGVLKSLKTRLAFTDEEITKHNIREDKATGNTMWDSGEDVEFEFGPTAVKILKESVISAGKVERMSKDLVPFYEKYIGELPTEE